MKAYTILAALILVAMVSGQYPLDPSGQYPPSQYQEPSQNPGEIIHDSGLTISYLINAAAGIWQQERVIDSLAYACTDVLPLLGSLIPDIDQSSFYWGHICDRVIEAAKDIDAFDASGFCNDAVEMVNGLVSEDAGGRIRRQVDPSMEDPLGIVEILTDVVRDLYGIDISMIIEDPSKINTICTNVKDNFLKPSMFDLISQFGTELMTALLPQAVPICEDVDSFLQSVGIDSNSAFYPVIKGAAFRVGSQAMGYDSRDDLCQSMEQALAVEGDNNAARKTFSRNIISSIFDIPEHADRCSTLANGAVNDVIEPLLRIDNPDGFELTNDMINTYTGFQGVTAVCNALEIAFTTVVDLPDPVPVKLIPGTTLTVEFFIDAAGGIWQQDRLIDSLTFVCTDVLPDLESMIPEFRTYTQDSWSYGPVCDKVLGAAENLEDFDATAFCNGLITMATDLIEGPAGDRYRRQVDGTMQDPLDILQILGDVTKNLYNIDINDPSTICPNVAQFLSMSVPDIITQFGAEVMVAYLPQAAPICKDWDDTFIEIGIGTNSPYYPIIQDAARIGSQLVGYDSRQGLCLAIDEVLAVSVDSEKARRTFAMDAIKSAFGIYTDTARCSMYGNDLINDIIEPIVSISVPLMISDYTISRYTGLMGVEGVCRAMETAFTKLSGSIVMLQITGENLNGEELVYTADLANNKSSRFQKLEMLYCGVVENHLTDRLGSSFRKLKCRVVSFSAGSIIAEMEIEVYATTQDVADSLARDVADLSTGNSLTLSSNGDSLTVSSFKGTAAVGDGGLATGAIIGIVIGVIVMLMLVVFVIICFVMHSGKRSNNDTELGVNNGKENPGYSPDEKPGYGK